MTLKGNSGKWQEMRRSQDLIFGHLAEQGLRVRLTPRALRCRTGAVDLRMTNLVSKEKYHHSFAVFVASTSCPVPEKKLFPIAREAR